MKETNFKHTDIGDIPHDWKLVQLGEVGYTYNGITGKSAKDFGKGEAAYITFLNVLNNPIIDTSILESVDIAKSESQNSVKKDDLFFNTSSETPEDVGTCAVLLEDVDNVYLNSFCFGYRLTDSSILGKYLAYYFRSKQGRNLMTKLAQGATRYNLSKVNFNNSYIPFPPTIAEQERIATALSDMDNLLAHLDLMIDKKQLIKQAAMQQLLSGKTRLKGFNEKWVEHTIDDLFDLGNGYTPSKSNPAYWTNGTIPWFRMEDIRSNGRILKDSIQHITPEAVKGSGLFPKYSIILSTTATIGEHALLIADSLANQQFTFLNRKVNRCNEIDIMYFYHYCFILGKWCRENINAGGLLAVNMDDLKNHSIYMPQSIAEQQAIASTLTAIDEEIQALQSQRDKYALIKQGMMQQLLTGKTRI